MKNMVACLLYHDVTDEPRMSGFNIGKANSYKISYSCFEGQLNTIASTNMTPVSIYDISAIGKDRERFLMLSFDDGGKSALNIANCLDEREWKGHFFIPTSFIGKAGFLDTDDIYDLHKRGHIIGSHSHTHPLIFYDLNKEDMRKEWRSSLDILSSITGESVSCASVSGGDIDHQTLLSAQEEGVEYLFTSDPKIYLWQQRQLKCIGRFCIKRGFSNEKVRKMVMFQGYRKEQMLWYSKKVVKLLFPSLYRIVIESRKRNGH